MFLPSNPLSTSWLCGPVAIRSSIACRCCPTKERGLPAGSGRGRGIGFARYKNLAAYAAIVAEVETDREVRVLRVWCAADAGLVVNPDGARNQLEGGIVQ